MLSALRQDLTFALRQLRRSPGFAASAIVTLALGIGATTAIFSLVDGILLRPLPFPNAERLVAVETLEFPPGVAPTNIAAANYLQSSYPDYFDWRRQNRTFESLASYNDITRLFSRNDGVGARILVGGRVSANFFPTIGVSSCAREATLLTKKSSPGIASPFSATNSGLLTSARRRA